MTGKRRVGHVVDARVERDRPFSLGANRALDGVEDVGVGEAYRPHVVAGEEQEIEGLGSHTATICETEPAGSGCRMRYSAHGRCACV